MWDKMTLDLTKGKTSNVLLRYSLPLFGSVIFQQLYNIADSFVAGKFIGEEALASVGNSYEVTLIYLAFAFGLNIGASVVIARFFGEKRFSNLKTAVSTAYITCIAVCVLLMIIGFTFTPDFLHLINTPPEAYDDTILYLNIYTGGLIFLFLYNISTGIFAALGDSKTPFIFLAISSVTNIFMDILFVKEFKMGIAGVAWATFICQSVSCIFSVIVLLKQIRKIECEHKPKLFSFSILKKILIIAIPSTLQQSFISVGNIAIQSIINSFGTSAMAGYAAAVKFNTFAITSCVTVGNGVSNFTAQNLGANSTKRVKEGFKSGIKMILVISIFFAMIYIIFPEYIIKLFLNSDSSEALDVGVKFLRIVSPFYIIVSIKLIADGILRGAGKMTQFMVATLTDLALRVALSFIMSAEMGLTGIWVSWPIGWIIATVMSVSFYKSGKWKQKVSSNEKS